MQESSQALPKMDKKRSLATVVQTQALRAKQRDPLMKLATSTYNEVEAESPGYAMRIDVVLNGMRFTFLNRFVDETELMVGHEELAEDTMTGDIPEDEEVEKTQA